MPATFTYDLPARPGCPARPCGVGNQCFLQTVEGAESKSADGSGVIVGTILTVTQINLTLWRYTVEVDDDQVTTMPAANEMQLYLACIGAESDSLLKKYNSGGLGPATVVVKIGSISRVFAAAADTDVSRMAALQSALEYADLSASPAVVELSAGNYAIAAGVPLSTYASNATIEFQTGAAVIYADPVDATADSGFYSGPRNVLNFGAVPSDDFTSSGPDCLNALKAAHNSLPIPEGSEHMGYGETPPVAGIKGTGVGYITTSAGFPIGTISIPIISGSGTVLVRDVVTFAGDTRRYTVTSGVAASGTITISPALGQAIPPSPTAMTIMNGGTGVGYTSSALGFPIGTTSIPIITGSGTVLIGDIVTFAGDANEYRVTTGVTGPGTIVITPGLIKPLSAAPIRMAIRGVGTDLKVGVIYFPAVSPEGINTVYNISDTWYTSAFANLEGENRYIYINFLDNVATVSEKFVVYMLSNVSQGMGSANTFNASLNNIGIRGNRIRDGVVKNAFSSGLRFSCAQGGTIGWLEITECSLRGFVTDINGGSINAGYLTVSGVTRGPGISLYTCYSFVAAQVVCSFINRYLWAKDADGDYYAALLADGCKGINIDAFQAEDVSTGVKAVDCNGVYIPILSTSKYLRSVSAASFTSPIVITDIGHNRTTGDKVTIRGALGNTAANVEDWPITVIDANTFSLNGRNGNAAYGGGGLYLPGLNAGVIVKGTDSYDFGLDVNSTTYAFLDKTLLTNVVGSFLGDVKGKYHYQGRLDNRLSFVNGGTVESRTGDVTISAVSTASKLVAIQAGLSYTLFATANVLGTNDSLLQISAATSGNSVLEGVGNTESLCLGTSANKPVRIRPNRTTTAAFNASDIVLSTLVNPAVTNTLDLGSSGVIWRSLYAAQLRIDRTDTATVGAVIINKAAGSVKFAATAISLVITNSLVTDASRVIATVNTVDTTLKSVVAVCTFGAITLTGNAAATAVTNVSFLVLNP